MEKTTVLKIGKYISIWVMLLTAVTVAIAGLKGYLDTQSYGQVIVALGVFLVALRNYLKDTYGLI